MFLVPEIKKQYFNSAGNPLASGKLYSYLAGTTTPQATYADISGSSNNDNPIILDSEGRVGEIYMGGVALKFVLKDSNDNVIWTQDNVTVSPITTRGDIIIGGVDGIQKRLAKGAEGTVLQMGANEPAWSASPDLTVGASKTADYTVLVSDDLVRVDCASGNITLTFPNAANATNKVIICRRLDTGTFSGQYKATISGTGMTTNYLMTNNEAVGFVSDGTNWIQIWRETDTQWATYLLTIGGTTTAPTKPNAVVKDVAKWRRVGDSIHIRYQYYHTVAAGSAAGSGSYLFPIPFSTYWTIDSGKIELPVSSTTVNSIVGSAHFSTTSAQSYGHAFVSSATSLFLSGVNETNRSTLGSAASPMTDATVIYTFDAIVPITNMTA